jgi:hypothetical protein
MSKENDQHKTQNRISGLDRRKLLLAGTSLAAACAVQPVSAQAQEVLPRPESPFKGTLGTTYMPDREPFHALG